MQHMDKTVNPKTADILYQGQRYLLENQGEYGRDGFVNCVVERAKTIPPELEDPKLIEDYFENTIHEGIDIFRTEEDPYKILRAQFEQLVLGNTPGILEAMRLNNIIDWKNLEEFQFFTLAVESYTSEIIFNLEEKVYLLLAIIGVLGRLRGDIMEGSITLNECFNKPTGLQTKEGDMPLPATYLDLFGEKLLKAMFEQYERYQS